MPLSSFPNGRLAAAFYARFSIYALVICPSHRGLIPLLDRVFHSDEIVILVIIPPNISEKVVSAIEKCCLGSSRGSGKVDLPGCGSRALQNSIRLCHRPVNVSQLDMANDRTRSG
jgi:hypothetical protein